MRVRAAPGSSVPVLCPQADGRNAIACEVTSEVWHYMYALHAFSGAIGEHGKLKASQII